jgi:two-component system CheB/CheR fusion protein
MNSKKKKIETPPTELETPVNVSPRKYFPIVGIGASAGGLAAFEAFFSGMPAETEPNMAFVLVQHLDPDHKSILTEIIRQYTRMNVFEVEDGMIVKPNCTYIIPPGHNMAILNGTLQLLEPSSPRGQRLPINFFFHSLAVDQQKNAISIVLSGTGSDGTEGIKSIKSVGGMVLAQTPDSAEFNGMPKSAIATGLVDYELPPAKMPARLMAYVNHLPETMPDISFANVPDLENQLNKIYILLRAQTGHDFSCYKINTVHRRIERRMMVHQITELENYVKYLSKAPNEVDALFHDLLIGVTSFFRDSEAFKIIEEQVVANIFAGKRASETIRIWIPACSTGEEAYSIAILLAERQQAMKQIYKVQVFATDIDSNAIAIARAGIYPASITSNVSPERIARFFTIEPSGDTYRIHKGIRDMLVFSEQDVIKDPPFSKMDLISCRNMMIYMTGDLQEKLIPLFYYALKPNGFLFLGTSESIGNCTDLFVTLNRKSKIYKRRDDIHGTQRITTSNFLPAMTAVNASLPIDLAKMPTVHKISMRELTEHSILKQIIQTAVLVNGKGDILYLHGHTGMYLELAPGDPGINNILKMAREGLKSELTTILHKVVNSRATLHSSGIRVKTNGHYTMVDMVVSPAVAKYDLTSNEPLYLVVLNEAAIQPAMTSNELKQQIVDYEKIQQTDPDIAMHILELKKELLAKEEYLQVCNEELETSNEELKSSNEEMQSVNEELQSTNEELETSKEELQSINEELATVNSELQIKVGDLSQVNNDMNNLLSGTGIATVFVDNNMRLMRYTPHITNIINLIIGDLGRPVGHVVSNLVGYNNLVTDIQAVLDTLIPKEIEVNTQDGKWYIMRIKPYRTIENVIEGTVITFVDITDLKNTRDSLRKANEIARLAIVVSDSYDAITVQDLDGKIIAWNPGAERMYGWSEAEALLMNVRNRIPQNNKANELAIISKLAKSQILKPYKTQRITKNNTILDIWLTSTALIDENGEMYAIATTERIIEQNK